MSGIEMIAIERQRQVEGEGWSASHDDAHTKGEMALAGAIYAWPPARPLEIKRAWPWDRKWWKPSESRVRDLVRAGALIAAEIDRIERAAALAGSPDAAQGGQAAMSAVVDGWGPRGDGCRVGAELLAGCYLARVSDLCLSKGPSNWFYVVIDTETGFRVNRNSAASGYITEAEARAEAEKWLTACAADHEAKAAAIRTALAAVPEPGAAATDGGAE